MAGQQHVGYVAGGLYERGWGAMRRDHRQRQQRAHKLQQRQLVDLVIGCTAELWQCLLEELAWPRAHALGHHDGHGGNSSMRLAIPPQSGLAQHPSEFGSVHFRGAAGCKHTLYVQHLIDIE